VIKSIREGDQLVAHITNMRYHEDNQPNKTDYGWYVQPQIAFRRNQGPTSFAIMGAIHKDGKQSRFVAYNPPIISELGKDGTGGAGAATSSSSSSSS
jgi:hypothetical protein